MAEETVAPLPNSTTVDKNNQETNPPVNPYPTANGSPTTSAVASGNSANTAIAASANNRSHICDTTLYVQRNVSLAKLFEPTIRAIRDAVQYIMKALGFNPGSSALVEQIKKIKRFVDDLQEFLQEIQDAIKYFKEVVQKIIGIINYILSLPARFLAYLQNCLKEAFTELRKQITDLVSSAKGDELDTKDITNAMNDLEKSIKDTVSTGTSIVKDVASLPSAVSNPATITDADAKTLATEYFGDFNTTKKYETA